MSDGTEPAGRPPDIVRSAYAELIVTDRLDDGGDRGYAKNGWAWYTGI